MDAAYVMLMSVLNEIFFKTAILSNYCNILYIYLKKMILFASVSVGCQVNMTVIRFVLTF